MDTAAQRNAVARLIWGLFFLGASLTQAVINVVERVKNKSHLSLKILSGRMREKKRGLKAV
jgi:hypothetical protein